MTNKYKIALRLLLVLLTLSLSGCIKATTSITVQPDGTGAITTTLGFPIKLVGEMTLQGIDPVKNLRQFLFNNLGFGTDFDQSDDSTHEQLIITRQFASVDELTDLLQKQDFFESFSLRRNRGFLKDEFVLDAQLTLANFSDPLNFALEDEAGNSISAASQPIDFQVNIQLPGNIIETNGAHDVSTKTITWTTDNSEPFELHAISESLNTSNLAVTAGLAILGIALILAIVILIMRSRRKSMPKVDDVDVQQRLDESFQPVEDEEEPLSSKPEIEEVFPPSKILAMIGARELLDQVNHHVLSDRGEITVAKGAMRLVWTDQENTTVTRGIMITVQDTETIVINGVPFPATRDAARQGLISCLKGMTKQ